MEAGHRAPTRPSHQLSPQPNSFLSRTGTPPAADSPGPRVRSSSFLATQSSPSTAALCTVRSLQRSNPSPSCKLELAINSPASPPSPPFLFSRKAPPETMEFITGDPPICRCFWPNLAPPVSPSPHPSPSRLPLFWRISLTTCLDSNHRRSTTSSSTRSTSSPAPLHDTSQTYL
jgi:hypothetical protein